jgi:2-phospho-L-lactate guanylyltransferase (CobY/MobA/RfbA family)
MSILLIPVAPLSRSKSRLSDFFSRTQLKELTVSMFKDLGNTLKEVNCFDNKIVYSSDSEILELADRYGLIGIKEKSSNYPKSFDDVISNLNSIASTKYNASRTILIFLDLILISPNNFYEVNSLLENNQIVLCPAINSAGISILGRNPPEIISTCFSSPNVASSIALLEKATMEGIKKIAIYDSFKASFDIDIKEDILLAYNYLKVFSLTHTHIFKFLKENLNYSIRKLDIRNNRSFEIIKKKDLKSN